MHRRQLLALSGALAATAIAGCRGDTEGSSPDETPTEETTQSPTPTATEQPPSGQPSAPDARLAELAAGNAGFALDLHRHLADTRGGNQFLSPYSISVALAMTYAGAEGETEAQMRETLNYTLGADVHPAFADLRAALESRETAEQPMGDDQVDAFRLAIANAVWGREDVSFAEDYLALLEDNYGGGLRRADFAGDPQDERDRINDWVADATGGRIEELLPRDAISPQTVLVLTNAIYFVANWAFQFDPEETRDGTFRSIDGDESTVPMMRQNLRTNYVSLPRAQAVELPYVGEQVSMVLLVPDEGEFAAVEDAIDAEYLFGVFEALGDASGDLRMPRFEYETEVQLSEPLRELGMPVAFESSANFDGMVPGDAGLWIDEVYHQAAVSVDEEGTEATAATAAVVEESMPERTFDLSVDRPFLYLVRDRPTDAVLFLGRVVDAGAAQ